MQRPFIGRQEEGENTEEIPSQRKGNADNRGITPEIIDSLIRRESTNNARAKGKAGESGLMQIKPIVAMQYGVQPRDLMDPEVNRAVGTQYLNDLYKQFGSVPLALAAYNAGPTRVRRGDIPNSTKNYVRDILGGVGSVMSKAMGEGTAEGAETLPTSRRSLSSFKSYDDAAAYLSKQAKFHSLSGADQDAALQKLRSRWEALPTNPEDGPDLTGRLNERAGKFADSTGIPGAGAITRAILPSNNIQAGIDLAMAAAMTTGVGEGLEAGNAAVRLGGRLLPAIVGGAAGGATEGKTVEGAGVGAAQGVAGEVLSPLANKIFGNTIGRLDRERMGKWLRDTLPTKLPFRSVGDFDLAFRKGLLRQEMGPLVEQANSKVAKTLGKNQDIQITLSPALANKLGGAAPMLKGRQVSMPFQDVLQTIREMEDLGRYNGSDSALRLSAKEARVSAHQMVDDLAGELNQRGKGLGDEWMKARKQYSLTMTMQQMMQEPGVFDPKTGQMSIPKIQALASGAGKEGYRDELQRAGADESFLKTAFRNAKATVATDKPGQVNPYFRMHMGIIPSVGFHEPQFARHVGELPYDLGRGRALSSALVLGPHRVLNLIANEMGRDVPYPDHEPKPAKRKWPEVLPPTKVVRDDDSRTPAEGGSPTHMTISKTPEEMRSIGRPIGG